MIHRRLIFATFSVATAWLALTACGGGAAPIDPLEVGDPARGQEFFETGADVLGTPCEGCHSLDGVDGEHGPTLQGISERAGERVPGMNAEEYLRQSILEPGAYLVEGYEDEMEPFYELLLTEDDIDDIVAYLLTQ